MLGAAGVATLPRGTEDRQTNRPKAAARAATQQEGKVPDLVETYAGTVTPWWAGSSPTAKIMDVIDGVETVDVDDLFVRADLADWDVQKQPMMIGGPYPMVIPDIQANQRMRDGRYLGYASPGYPIVQNEVLRDFGKALMGGGLRSTTAGSLKSGRVVWITYDVPMEDIRIPGDPSTTKIFLLTRNGFDARHAFGAHVSPMRTVCWNTMVGAIDASWASVYLRHTANMEQKIDDLARDAQRTLGIIPKAVERWTAQMTDLTTRPLSRTDFADFVDLLIPIPATAERPFRLQSQRRDLLTIFDTSPLLDGLSDTAYKAFNAVSEWADHGRPYGDGKNAPGADRRALSIMEGWAAQKKDAALAILAKA